MADHNQESSGVINVLIPSVGPTVEIANWRVERTQEVSIEERVDGIDHKPRHSSDGSDVGPTLT